ncbi:MAG: tetratricopeptide repeat protein [Bacteroidota bacterium]
MRPSYFLIFCALFLGNNLLAQKSAVDKAERFLKAENLAEAQKEINNATKDSTLNTDPKTWLLYGQIFEALHETSPEKEEELLTQAVFGYNQACALSETTNEHCIAANLQRTAFGEALLHQGNTMFDLSDFKRAIYWFKKAQLVLPDNTDALLFAGLAAQELGDYVQVNQHFGRLAEIGYRDLMIYETLIFYAKTIQKDNEKTFEWIQKTKQHFPNDLLIQRQEINLLISLGKTEEAQQKLIQLAEANPKDEVLHFDLAYTYEQLGDIQAAAERYKQAIELAPNYFDPVYNLGALYVNHAAELYQAAKELKMNDYKEKATAKKEEAKNALRLALPYLEKAAELRSEEAVIWQTLSMIYSRLKMEEKAQSATAKFEALQDG